jgi:hypothetical protein
MNNYIRITPPCLNCLLIPACKFKQFLDTKDECRMFKNFLFNPPNFITARNDFEIRVNDTHEILNPKKWKKIKDPKTKKWGFSEVKCYGYFVVVEC